MAATHTPGPWTTKKHGGKVRVFEVEQGLTVAHVPIGYMTRHWEDATLMAAAPRLLNALRQLSSASEGGSADEINAAQMEARAAIAEAGGQS